MKVKTRPLNNGETFACSIKKAKDTFKDTPIYLSFAYLGRDFSTFEETPDWYFYKKNIRGRVLSSMQMSENYPEPILGFYVIKEKLWGSELQDEYENKLLPAYLRLYQELTDIQQPVGINKIMLVELVDGKLILHEGKL